MSTFVKYVNEVQIPSVDLGAAGSWNTVDISALMQDTSAIGVTIRVFTGVTTQTNFGVRSPGATNPPINKVFQNHYIDHVVSFGGSGNNIEVHYTGSTAGQSKFFVTGEIHDNAALHDNPPKLPLVEPWSTWQDVQVTVLGGDAPGDVAAVIVQHFAAEPGRFGLREKGTTKGDIAVRWEGSAHWYVVGVDSNGFYQAFTSGKSSAHPFTHFYEVGYVLKTGDVVTIDEPTGMSLAAQDGSYAAIDFSGDVFTGAIVVGGHWSNLDITPTATAFLRATGSTENTSGILLNRKVHHGGGWVGLDANRKAEYQTETAAVPVDFFVEWFEAPPTLPVATSIADAPTVGRSPGVATRSIAVVDAIADAPVVATIITIPIVGLVKGTAEVSAAVAGAAEVSAAVAGTAEVSAARKA